jgi:hypothetical protein
MNCTATVTPSHGPGRGPAPLGNSPEAQAGARGTEEGTGGESKEEERKGRPGPFKLDSRGYSAFQYILYGQAPETNRCGSRSLRTQAKPKKGGPRPFWPRPAPRGAGNAPCANPLKSLFRTLPYAGPTSYELACLLELPTLGLLPCELAS